MSLDEQFPNTKDCSAMFFKVEQSFGLLDLEDKATALFYMNTINQQHSATNHRTQIISSTAVRTLDLPQAVFTHLFIHLNSGESCLIAPF